jgi:hypothetical protein
MYVFELDVEDNVSGGGLTLEYATPLCSRPADWT